MKPVARIIAALGLMLGAMSGQTDPFTKLTVIQNQRGTHTRPVAVSHVGKATQIKGSQSYTYRVSLFARAGRGGLDLNLALNYNSLVWDSNPGGGVLGLNLELDSPSPGFRLGFGRLLWSSSSSSGILIDSDGTKHALVPVSGSTTAYQSNDATYIQVQHPSSGNDVVTFKSGRQMIFQASSQTTGQGATSSRPVQIEDTNGNLITITYANSIDDSISTIVDSVGRTLTFFYDLGNGQVGPIGPGWLKCITDGASCSAAGSRTFTFSWNHNYTLNYNFSSVATTAPASGSGGTSVLTGVTRPDGTSVQFNYGDWEIVNDIKELSSSGNLRYELSHNFPLASAGQLSCPPAFSTETVFDGVNTGTWNYSATTNTNNVVTSFTVTDPLGTATTTSFSANNDWTAGLPIQDEVTAQGKTWKTVNRAWTSDNGTSGNNIRVAGITTILDDGTTQSQVLFGYDSFFNGNDRKEYDLGSGAPGPLLRETVTTYATNLDTIVDRPADVQIKDGSGNVKSHTTLSYDGASVQGPSYTPVQHDNTNYSASSTKPRGNLTSTTSYTNAAQGTGAITSTFTYDVFGNRLTSQLGCCTQSQAAYSSITQSAYPDSVTAGPSGNQLTTSFAYNLNRGTVASTTDPNGQTTSVTYDLDNRVSSTQTPDGVTISDVYDDSGVSPAVTISSSANNLVTKKTTNFRGHALSEQVFNGNALVSTKTFVHDAVGRQTQASNPYGPNDTPVYTTYIYDPLGRITLSTPPALSSGTNQNGYQASYSAATVTMTDPAGKQRKQYSDGLGRLVRVDEPGAAFPGTASSGSLTMSGSLKSLSTSGTYATGSANVSGSDSMFYSDPCTDAGQIPGCPTPVYDYGYVYLTVNGHTDSAFYSQSSTAASIASALASAINSDAGEYVNASASNGTISMTARQIGANGNYSWTLNAASGDTTDPFDPNGSFANPAISGTLSGGTNGQTIYDSGNVSITIGSFTASAPYGQSGNSTAAQVASALVSSGSTGLNRTGSPVTASASGSTIGLTYKAVGTAGNVTVSCSSATSQGSYFSSPSFSCAGNTLSGGQNSAPPSLSNPYTTQYSYDVLNDLLQVTQGQQTRTYSYDSLGRVTSSCIPETGNQCATRSYTDFGAIAGRVDPRGITTSYTYDSLDRVAGVSYSDGTPSVSYTYGAPGAPNNTGGRLATMTDGTGSETYRYDVMGRVLQRTETIGSNGYPITYSYNAAGELASMTYPSGRIVNRSYDAVGRLTQVGTNGLNLFIASSYNAASQLLTASYGNGVNATYTYNNQMQLASLVYANSSAGLLNLSYNWGGASDDGLIAGITDNLSSARSTSYTYDALSQLATAQTVDQTSAATWGLSFSYDRYGNRISETSFGGSAAQPGNQITVDPTTNHILTSGYTYDADGDMTGDGLHTYSYDGANRIVHVDGTANTYAYDGNNMRVNRNGTYYIFSGGQVIAEYASGAAASSPSAEHVYGAGRRIATIASGATTYHFWDHLSIRAAADSSGNVVRTFGSFPFGETWYETGTASPWKFTTYLRDSESGLDYANERFDSSRLGRFMSLDPLTGHLVNPQSLNRYVYAGNNPIGFSDPTGMAKVAAVPEPDMSSPFDGLNSLVAWAGAVGAVGGGNNGGLVLTPGVMCQDDSTNCSGNGGSISFGNNGSCIPDNQTACITINGTTSAHCIGISCDPSEDPSQDIDCSQCDELPWPDGTVLPPPGDTTTGDTTTDTSQPALRAPTDQEYNNCMQNAASTLDNSIRDGRVEQVVGGGLILIGIGIARTSLGPVNEGFFDEGMGGAFDFLHGGGFVYMGLLGPLAVGGATYVQGTMDVGNAWNQYSSSTERCVAAVPVQ